MCRCLFWAQKRRAFPSGSVGTTSDAALGLQSCCSRVAEDLLLHPRKIAVDLPSFPRSTPIAQDRQGRAKRKVHRATGALPEIPTKVFLRLKSFFELCHEAFMKSATTYPDTYAIHQSLSHGRARFSSPAAFFITGFFCVEQKPKG